MEPASIDRISLKCTCPPQLAVHVATMAYMEHSHPLLEVIYFINHPDYTNSDTPSISTRQFEATSRPWDLGQASNRVANPSIFSGR